MHEKELLPHLFRTEYRKIISVLVKHFGFEQFSLAEDIASDTFLIAAETWGIKGLPENPVAQSLSSCASGGAARSCSKSPA